MGFGLRLHATALLFAVASIPAAHAVSPLFIDDADPVDRGSVQLNGGWRVASASSGTLHTVTANPVVGVDERGELGATFGYQWQATAPAGGDADGITDLTLETKWRLWRHAVADVSARLDLKVPTASERRGLGTGHPDLDAILIATRCWASVCLDGNVGYGAIDLSRADPEDDAWSLGAALRYAVTERWTALAESYGIVPQGGGADATGHFDAGALYSLREGVLLWALVGSAVGPDSPDVAAAAGFTWVLSLGQGR